MRETRDVRTVGWEQYESRQDENMREPMRGQDKEVGLHIRV